MEPAEEGQEDRFLRKDHPRGQSRGRHQVRKSACLQPMHSEAASPPSVESAVMVQWVSTPVYPLQSRQNDGRSWTNVPEALVTSELPSSSDTAPFFFFFFIAPFLTPFCISVSLAPVHRPCAFFFQHDATFCEFAETSALLGSS